MLYNIYIYWLHYNIEYILIVSGTMKLQFAQLIYEL